MRPRATTINASLVSYTTAGLLLITGILMAFLIAAGDIQTGAAVLVTPIALAFVVLVFYNPYVGLMAYLNYSFFFIGLNRYFPNLSLGVTIDAILFLTTIALLARIKWDSLAKLHNGIFYVTLVWFIYTLLQLFNPEVRDYQALFFAIRGLSLYAVQVIPLTLLWMDSKRDFNNFVNLILGWAVLSAFWGLRQMWFGPDYAEYLWLESGGKITHIVNERLRAFSFYSDAGQYGTTMAYAALLGLIMAMGPYKRGLRFLYLVIAFISLVGFSISGSRGPVFVILFGFIFYLVLIRKFKILLIGSVITLLVFSVLKFTYIGQSNYQVFRIRTALDPKEASLMVRLSNQKLLRAYLEKRPFGSGIGTTDTWAKRYYPTSYLASIPTDSWFVAIWVQSGIIGLVLHLMGIAYVLVIGFSKIYQLKSRDLRQKLIAMYGGFFGVIVASFGNPIFGQAPIGALMYVSMVYMCIADKLDAEFMQDENRLIEAQQRLTS